MGALSDYVTCRCVNCDGHIEFPADRSGDTTQCPHCGMETRLYEPPCPISPPPIPAQTVHSPPPSFDGEPAFFNEGGVVVTKTRFIAHGQTFAIANITSVSSQRFPGDRSGAETMTTIGALAVVGSTIAIIVALFDVSTLGKETRLGIGIGGVVFVALGVVGVLSAKKWSREIKDTYAVVLNTAGGEIKTCSSTDLELICRVIAGLNAAIVARG